MKRFLACLVASQCVAAPALAQSPVGRIDPSHVPVLGPHFEPELLYDTPANPEAWSRVSPGLHAAFGSTDRSYARREVPNVDEQAAWADTGWRGERLNALVLVWSSGALEQVRVEAGDLTDADGHVLPRDVVGLRLVRYVLSNFPAGARNTSCDAGPTDAAWLLPDRLETLDRFDLPARTVRPVWVSLQIPASAAAGTYRGTLVITTGDASTTLRFAVQVQTPVLPPPREWQFQLDLWQNPWVIAWRYGLRPWSDEHKSLLKDHLRLYADAGGKYITTYAVHSPWQDNSYMIEGGMIDWIKQRDGTWAFDYRIFDEYVSLATDAGVTGAITVYTPLPWGHRFRYLDASTGAHVTATWPPESDTFRLAWRAFLTDLKEHLERRGWLSKTYLGINENPLEQTLAAIKVIREHWAQWRITYAGDWHPELSGLIEDYSAMLGKEPGSADIQARSGGGRTSTFYVCCTPPVPNTFVFSPPVEARWLGWYTAARGYDGFLRWAYDAWPADPVRDARHVLWPAGDTFLVYPGAASSLRYEKVREGIVDFEKIRIVRRSASASVDPDVRRLVRELERSLASVATEHEFDRQKLEIALAGARGTLAALSELVVR